MRLLRMKNIHEGAYLKHYELTYLNKSGKEKVFELVSRCLLYTSQLHQDTGEIAGETQPPAQEGKGGAQA